MACVENNTQEIPKVDYEREEGEIVDELDDLSDISSEEEFLLRQRLQVLENYNNVLERKARRVSVGPGIPPTKEVPCDLSDISASELEQICTKNFKEKKRKSKRKKDDNLISGKSKEHRKKPHRKKKLAVKVISESSDESEDEYRNKRRKLANAVSLSKTTSDKSTLSTRLKIMMGPVNNEVNDLEELSNEFIAKDAIETDTKLELSVQNTNTNICDDIKFIETKNSVHDVECVDLCTDEDVQIVTEIKIPNVDVVDGIIKENNKLTQASDKDSDDDLEALRQLALNTKVIKKPNIVETQVPTAPVVKDKQNTVSEDEDSDTAELRFICLKSAFLKKAIEMKQKQKLRKRLSQSANMHDLILNDNGLENIVSPNNTDIESVDMDIGSDIDEKMKENLKDTTKTITDITAASSVKQKQADSCKLEPHQPKEEELDEDEDVLRAKLLTSLSKNLPNLVDAKLLDQIDDTKMKVKDKTTTAKISTTNVTEEKRFIINLGESDSEVEHEATKNLTKMHMKLSEQVDFQSKLDMFLKSTRMEVENQKLPDVVQQPVEKKEKFVAKALNHLPKSEQIEYKNLVKRMAELEKLKQARQASMKNSLNVTVPKKETLKPSNTPKEVAMIINNHEEQISLSRKKIAEVSSHVLKLKEEATKLSQKYKIVQTELRNITTAITLNKKEQRAAQIRLSKIRTQHQMLLTSSHKHSPVNGIKSNKIVPNKLQKENNPEEEFNNSQILKSFKVSVVNDFNDKVSPNKLSVPVDISSSKKTVKVPKTVDINLSSHVDIIAEKARIVVKSKDGETYVNQNASDVCNKTVNSVNQDSVVRDKSSEDNTAEKKNENDYRSPLDALTSADWNEDPNAVLCPFEVAGNCKDPDCKFLHPKPKQ